MLGQKYVGVFCSETPALLTMSKIKQTLLERMAEEEKKC
jgi:hypothetical protein